MAGGGQQGFGGGAVVGQRQGKRLSQGFGSHLQLFEGGLRLVQQAGQGLLLSGQQYG